MAIGFFGKKRDWEARSFSRGRKILISLNVLVMVIVAAAILGGVWYLASLPQFRARWDLTKAQTYTLSPRTENNLSELEKDVNVIVFFDAPNQWDLTGESMAKAQVGAYTLDLLREYEIASNGRVRVETLERVRDSVRLQEVFQTLGFQRAQEHIVVVECGASRKVLIPEDLAILDRGRADPNTGVRQMAKVASYKAEAALTQAIIEVTEGRKPVACVLAGRGESQISSNDDDGLSLAAAGLRNTNFDVREIRLAAGGAIPEECDVLIIAGPRDEYGPAEMAAIKKYLQGGGSIFLALDPFACASFDGEILPAYGVALDRTVTCRDLTDEDPETKLLIPAKTFSRESRITKPLSDNSLAVLFFRTGGILKGAQNYSIEGLVWSPLDVWGDTHPPNSMGDYEYDSQTEKREQRTMGISCQGQNEYAQSRMVFFADASFFTNWCLQRGGGNLLLFTNSINWLAAREKQLDIGPKVPFESRVELYQDEYQQIGLYVMLFIPLAAAILGLVVWWFRRR